MYKNRRKLRIVNRFRFIMFLLVLIIFLATFFYAGSSLFSKVSRSNEKETFLSLFEKVEVNIKEGDTAWTIQENLTPNHDVRKTLFYSRELNDVSIGNIKPGTTLTFLKEKE